MASKKRHIRVMAAKRVTERTHNSPGLFGLVEVWIDWELLLRRLGPRAMRAKGRKASALGGAIVVEASGVQQRAERSP